MNQIKNSMTDWLMSGDVSIQYHTAKWLLEAKQSELVPLRKRIASEGFGLNLMNRRNNETKMWGEGIYSPKWISTHYTLLELLNIGYDMDQELIRESALLLLNSMWINKGEYRKHRYQDLCVTAMILQICVNAHLHHPKLLEIVDYILEHQYPDGGWNCQWQNGDLHSSLHTTLSVLEAFRDFEKHQYPCKILEVQASVEPAIEFMLKKHLFLSVHDGQIIDPKMMLLSFPTHWCYDVLRVLVYLTSIDWPYDERMKEAIDFILSKKTVNNRWKLETARRNKIHFAMEPQGKESRWNTLRVLYVLKKYRKDEFDKIMSI